MSLKNEDQRYLDISEPQCALAYMDIAAEHDVKVTLFASGKAIEEENSIFEEILGFQNVELGGHTYYTFTPKWLYNGIFSRLLGLSNGPAIYQNWEIRKTVTIFKETLGVKIVSWRDHSYRHDNYTYKLLYQNGIRYVSDEVTSDEMTYSTKDGLVSVPINVVPDHDRIYHANLTPEATKDWSVNRDPFPPKLYPIEEWLEIVRGQVNHIIRKRGVATILAHPACMKIADGFKVFEKLCEFISHHKSVLMKELEREGR